MNVLKRYGIDTAGLEQKKILFASEDMGRNFENNEVAVFDQYILATPLYINANRLFCNMIWQDVKNQEKREASDLIFSICIQCILGGRTRGNIDRVE